MDFMNYPLNRLRRLRRSQTLRDLVAETSLSPSDFVAPLFVREDISEPNPVSSLPGVFQHTQESLLDEVLKIYEVGVKSIILFGIPAKKDSQGSQAWDPDGVVQIALRNISDKFGDDILLMADLCLDEYTDHGHCGLINNKGEVDNDSTLELYAQVALAQAEAGANLIAPSGMMDGQVLAIRNALDSSNYQDIPILAYAAKYASSFYGPFRDAVNVSIADGGDRKAYQQDPRNSREALEEVRLDISEGADMVMVKPAMPYLDIISLVKSNFNVPVAAYQVSGEYAMIKAAAANGWIDEPKVVLESLTSIKRAGADFILNYFSKDVAEILNN